MELCDDKEEELSLYEEELCDDEEVSSYEEEPCDEAELSVLCVEDPWWTEVS